MIFVPAGQYTGIAARQHTGITEAIAELREAVNDKKQLTTRIDSYVK
jgi:hypothetical protein